MAQVLIRNIDDAAIERLRARAARKKTLARTRASRHHHRAAQEGRPEARRRAAVLRRALTGRKHSDSTKLVRQDRDR